MLSIKEFARLAGISVRMLRHDDSPPIGARPAEIERRLRSIERGGLRCEFEFVRKSLPAVHLAQLVTT